MLSPVVDVIVSAPEGGPLLDRTLASIEAQTFPCLEVICVQPATTDKKRKRAHSIGKQLTLTKKADGSAWKEGLRRASGRYVCFLLEGDVLDPTYLEKCLFRLETEGVDVAFAGEPAQAVMHQIGVVRTDLLRNSRRYGTRRALTGQRVDLVRSLAHASEAVYIPEVLARAAGAADRPSETATLPSQPAAPRRRLSFAGLIQARAEQPTVLLAMPFLTVGGGEAVVSRLCRQLNNKGYRILLYTTLPAPESQGDATDWFRDSVAGIYHLPQFLDHDRWPAFIAYLIRQHNVEILWLVGSSFTYDLLPKLAELFPGLGVIDLLFNVAGHTDNHLKYNYLIDRVVTETEVVRAWLKQRGGDPAEIAVIPNGIDIDAYFPQRKLDWRTLQPRVGEQEFVTAFIGRLAEEKGPEVFIEVAARFAACDAMKFVICGAGPMRASLHQEVEAMGLSNKVHFLGVISTQEYLPCFDAVVVCSWLDGRPNVILESLAMGVPVIASRVGGIPELIPAGDDDLLCTPGDADAFAGAIRRLAEDPDRYRNSCERARRAAEGQSSVAAGASGLAALFEEVRRAHAPVDFKLPLNVLAARLGYEDERKHPLARSRFPKPARIRIYCRNLLLYWKIRRAGLEPTLRESFDTAYYAQQYPDTRKWRLSPLLHYAMFGCREGRNPSAWFDTNYYLTANPDVARAGMNPLLHYVMWGLREGRACNSTP